MKRILVVTACWNAGKYIMDCIESVRQSKINEHQFEILHVIVDDASTDRSAEILKNIRDERIRTIFSTVNGGPSNARNLAVNAFEADYVFCLDADDIIFQNSLSYLSDILESSGMEWIYGNHLSCDENLRYRIGEDYYGWNFNHPGEILFSIYTGRHFFRQNSMVRQHLMKEAGLFRSEFDIQEDIEISVRYLLRGVLPFFFPAPLYIRRLHQTNISNDFHLKKQKDGLRRIYERHEAASRHFLTFEQIDEIRSFLELNPD